jgi:hypothetical protein
MRDSRLQNEGMKQAAKDIRIERPRGKAHETGFDYLLMEGAKRHTLVLIATNFASERQLLAISAAHCGRQIHLCNVPGAL